MPPFSVEWRKTLQVGQREITSHPREHKGRDIRSTLEKTKSGVADKPSRGENAPVNNGTDFLSAFPRCPGLYRDPFVGFCVPAMDVTRLCDHGTGNSLETELSPSKQRLHGLSPFLTTFSLAIPLLPLLFPLSFTRAHGKFVLSHSGIVSQPSWYELIGRAWENNIII